MVLREVGGIGEGFFVKEEGWVGVMMVGWLVVGVGFVELLFD